MESRQSDTGLGRQKTRVTEKVRKAYKRRSIQLTVSFSFTVIAIVCMAFMGIMTYIRYMTKSKEMVVENNRQLLDQSAWNLNTYLQDMMEISDTMYYNVIKCKDLTNESMTSELNLLYEANKSNLISIACVNEDGAVIVAAPIATRKKKIDITKQQWFLTANDEIENLQFSTPHVQNLFESSNYRYYWVISLSRSVEITYSGYTTSGVLLVDMNFSGIEQVLKQINNKGTGYVYLMNDDGALIYHPQQKVIDSNLLDEDNEVVAAYSDGVHEEVFEGTKRVVIVKTLGYTGWKLVSVIPLSEFAMNQNDIRYFTVVICAVSVTLLGLGNYFISRSVTRPIRRLERSVRILEDGTGNPDIYIGGTHEIRHLGRSIQSMLDQRKKLTEEMIKRQQEKRKSELDALQSQINPHFLYNTLDSVIWQIETGRNQDAVDMVKALANLFRISISKGKNIIPIRNEIAHAMNYVNIQKIRYKNKFEMTYEIDPAIEDYAIIKLVLQPLLENAIYYGVEAGDGEILLKGYEKDDMIYLEVSDNGMGMTSKQIDELLNGTETVRSKGSGIGIRNVQQRLGIYFKGNSELKIISDLDEGTTVQIQIPKMVYEEEKKNHEKAEQTTPMV